MKLKTEYLLTRINELANRLGVPKEVFKDLEECNYEQVLKKFGAETWCERNRVFNQPETKELSTIAPGAQMVLIAEGKPREFFTLVQIRNDGKEGKEEIGFPGGACNMWRYKDKIELEHPVITACREFHEEVGMGIYYEPIHYLAYITTTNHYKGYPDTYAPSMYYYAEVSFEDMKFYANGKGSKEGKIMMTRIKELKKYKWFPNAAEVFLLLMENYAK